MDYGYVCWRCREVSTRTGYGADQKCRQGHLMEYVGGSYVPRSRDDHKMWRLAEEKLSNHYRRSRPNRSVKRALWERQLLRAAKK